MCLCPHPPLLPGLRSHSYLLMASAETVYPAFAIGDKVPTQLPDLKEELSGGEETKTCMLKTGVLKERGIAPISNQGPFHPHPEKNHSGTGKKSPICKKFLKATCKQLRAEAGFKLNLLPSDP